MTAGPDYLMLPHDSDTKEPCAGDRPGSWCLFGGDLLIGTQFHSTESSSFVMRLEKKKKKKKSREEGLDQSNSGQK